jgi:hypothetical protein
MNLRRWGNPGGGNARKQQIRVSERRCLKWSSCDSRTGCGGSEQRIGDGLVPRLEEMRRDPIPVAVPRA